MADVDVNEVIFRKAEAEFDPGTLVYQLMGVLEEFKDRIVFVKEVVTYSSEIEKNFVSLYEGEEYYDLYIQSELKDVIIGEAISDKEDSAKTIKEIVDEFEEIIKVILNNTEEKIYVTIIFNKNILPEDEAWEIFNLMEKQGYNRGSHLELVLDKIKYPNWFVGIEEPLVDDLYSIESALKTLEEKRSNDYYESLDEMLKKSLLENDFSKTEKIMTIIERAKEKKIIP